MLYIVYQRHQHSISSNLRLFNKQNKQTKTITRQLQTKSNNTRRRKRRRTQLIILFTFLNKINKCLNCSQSLDFFSFCEPCQFAFLEEKPNNFNHTYTQTHTSKRKHTNRLCAIKMSIKCLKKKHTQTKITNQLFRLRARKTSFFFFKYDFLFLLNFDSFCVHSTKKIRIN